MGAILKFIIIFLVVSYLFRKVGGYFLKVLFGSNATTGNSYDNYRSSQSNDYGRSNETGKVHVTKRPQHNDKEPHVKGGEYVDFEEVKE